MSEIKPAITKHLIIHGRVQGVGFRYFTRKSAEELNLNGWVRNRADGTVEAVISGPESDVNEMAARLKRGPVSASVSDVTVTDQVKQPSAGFRVLR